MRFHLTPRPLLHLVTAILLSPQHFTYASPAPAPSAQAGFDFNELFARWDCGGTYCGYSSQLCCTGASTCYTDTLDQAQCGAGTTVYTSAAAGAGGYWEYYTTTYVETDLVTYTSVYSSYSQYPSSAATTWVPAATTTAYYTNTELATASEPLRGTSSVLIVATATKSPTTTIPFTAPVATGANITLTQQEANNGGGLSGGAIAGIVIGVLLGLALLALLCFCCCIRGVFALCGLGGKDKKKRRRVTEVEEYERRSHHSRGGGRTWYGAKRQPSRVSRYNEQRDDSGKGKWLGLAGGLAALWAVLGLKRRRNDNNNNRRRNDEKYSEYSYDSEYYSYTSPSSASSDDRRTRDTRRTRR